MAETVVIQGDSESGYRASGNLGYDTVPEVYAAGLEFSDVTRLDLGALDRIDSAGLALLVEWTCEARRQGKQLQLTGLPESFSAMIEVGGLRQVLNIQDS